MINRNNKKLLSSASTSKHFEIRLKLQTNDIGETGIELSGSAMKFDLARPLADVSWSRDFEQLINPKYSLYGSKYAKGYKNKSELPLN